MLLALTVALGGCGGNGHKTASTAKDDRVTELRNIDQLRQAFNTHPDVPRLIVLVSPT